MAEFINPAIVPKVTLPSGEKVPCIGMGTFGSDRVSAEDVSAAVAGAIRSGYRMFDCAACQKAMSLNFVIFATHVRSIFASSPLLCLAMNSRSEKYFRKLLKRVLLRERISSL